MKILQKPTSTSGADGSTSLREAFRASLSVMPGSEEARKMTATSGRICSAVLTKSDLIGSFVKMLLESSQWSSKARFLKWQVKGLFSTRVTEFADTDLSRPLPCNVSATILRDTDIPSSRCLFQLAPLEPPTDAIESLSSDTVLLQTPTSVQTDETPEKMRARAERNGYKNGTKYGSLTSQVKYDPLEYSPNNHTPASSLSLPITRRTSVSVTLIRPTLKKRGRVAPLSLSHFGERLERPDLSGSEETWKRLRLRGDLAGRDKEVISDADSDRRREIHEHLQPQKPNGTKPLRYGWEWYVTGRRSDSVCGKRWETFPTVSPIQRGNDGLPFNVDDLTISRGVWRNETLKAYGNAIVPQVMYEIFRAIEQTTNNSL